MRTEYYKHAGNTDANSWLGTKATANGHTAFLAADSYRIRLGDPQRIRGTASQKKFRDVDIVTGHHGAESSNSIPSCKTPPWRDHPDWHNRRQS